MWYSISIFVLLIENGTYLFISLSPPLSYNLLKIGAYILLIFLSPTISIDIERDQKKKTQKTITKTLGYMFVKLNGSERLSHIID